MGKRRITDREAFRGVGKKAVLTVSMGGLDALCPPPQEKKTPGTSLVLEQNNSYRKQVAS